MKRRSLKALAAAFSLTAPWVVVWVLTTGIPLLLDLIAPTVAYEPPALVSSIPTGGIVLLSGVAVLGASFLLAWAAETAEKDVPRSFAIAVLAVLAVAPEYAVDALYAFNAGRFAGTERGIEAGNLAVANMTGANRILIGIGWAGIALFTVYRAGSAADPAVETRSGFLADAVTLDRGIGLEVVFLLAATAWAFLVPLGGGIDALDMFVLVGIYVAYILVVLRGDVDPDTHHIGVPAYLQTYPKAKRVATVVGLFVYSGLLIFIAVEPFAHGLEELGQAVGVPSFFMIQWIAPLASESPELIVVVYLVNKARSTAGFNALISSKLNQWTLLIGTLVVVYSLALGRYGALPFDQKQSAEIWLTAAQSLFAISVLINFEISVREAVVILTLFVSQVLLEFLIIRGVALPATSYELLVGYSAVYVVLAAGLFVSRRESFRALLRETAGTISHAAFPEEESTPGADD
ncbi:sodium:calcium antiporter [Natronomonas marina]|jgi:cation:H+ antiporter|uniref:sodium:calcium antiporter n=1 Tax=Natronomonas marina TaxID=2961939 RepID=UPI0020C9F99B|nr:sodium:calcium antiporter [Natronomonas marina]